MGMGLGVRGEGILRRMRRIQRTSSFRESRDKKKEVLSRVFEYSIADLLISPKMERNWRVRLLHA
jgi:hypothetical protein